MGLPTCECGSLLDVGEGYRRCPNCGVTRYLCVSCSKHDREALEVATAGAECLECSASRDWSTDAQSGEVAPREDSVALEPRPASEETPIVAPTIASESLRPEADGDSGPRLEPNLEGSSGKRSNPRPWMYLVVGSLSGAALLATVFVISSAIQRKPSSESPPSTSRELPRGLLVVKVTPDATVQLDASCPRGGCRVAARHDFDDLAPGSYTLKVYGQGWITERRQVTVHPGRAANEAVALVKAP